MQNISIKRSTGQTVLVALAILALCAIVALYMAWHPSTKKLHNSIAIVEGHHYFQLEIDGKPIVFFSSLNADSTLANVALCNDSVMNIVHRDTAVWVDRFPLLPSCKGCLLTRNHVDTIAASAVPAIVEREKHFLDSLLQLMQQEKEELAYYLRVHGVQDEGYNMIADYKRDHDRREHLLQRTRQQLLGIGSGEKVSIRRVSSYTALYNNKEGKRSSVRCTPVQNDEGLLLMQTANQTTPEGVRAIFKHAHGVAELAGRAIADSVAVPQPIINGHGAWRYADGSYYEGHWKDGKRHGFGFSLSEGQLRVGEWKEDLFKGERLLYTNERIYGIDIARYQHEKGRRRYAIDWKRLRITHLGTLSKKQISGSVNYPVSFIFIKATEGKDIRNRYYAADYAAARKHGFRVGSYHFFSTKSTATEQAKHFLRQAHFNNGDLPPVLDVEPTNAQIKKMGGPEALFKAVRTWLSLVKQQTGVSPILYVNQQFVNKYLPLAPDIKRDYQVWIARYGEYKPDVRLAIWQLSPDGRVQGIRGDVDIDVFNGYQEEWQEFLRSCSFTSSSI